MFRSLLIAALCAGTVAGCASAPPPPPPVPIALTGTLDTSRPGIHFFITDAAETLKCSAHSPSGKLPETISLPLACVDGQTGAFNLTKAPDLRGTVTFANGMVGDVTFAVPAPVRPPPVAVTPPPPPVAASPSTYVTRSYTRSRYSTGYVRSHYRRSTNVRGHYRNGRYVSGHTRRGSYVRSHYRRR